MERLFNRYGIYTKQASELSQEVRELAKTFIEKNAPMYDIIDLQLVMGDAVDYEASFYRMMKGTEQRVLEKEAVKKKKEEVDAKIIDKLPKNK